MSDIKKCIFIQSTKSKPITTLLRKVTKHKNWNSELTIEKQWDILNGIINKSIDKYNSNEKLIYSQIQYKLSSYKYQDLEKNKWNVNEFITHLQIIQLLIQYEMKCQYCHETCLLLYEKVRDPKQWSLDRLDNELGHLHNNVCLSCLSCNLKRRATQYHKFLYTKHVVLCKVNEEETFSQE